MLAGIAGAAGVALAAVAAHKVESPALASAATLLMIHATAAVAVAGLSLRLAAAGWWIATAALMLISVGLFSGAIALRTLTSMSLFPGAAPVGGSLLILAWILVAILAIIAALRGR
jgi:uncharacterized membrane protein YgdD (TMEM256/DUF423 family)